MLSQHRDWAIGYARAGIPVFPLAPREKVPLLSVSEGGRGFRDATTDTDQIDMWWRAWPDANIGATPLVGNRVRHAVIDIDVQNGGDQSWERLISEHGEPPVQQGDSPRQLRRCQGDADSSQCALVHWRLGWACWRGCVSVASPLQVALART